MRKEVWYKPDLSLYCDMIQLLGKNRMTEMAERVFTELDKEGLKPDTRAFTEMIGAYLIVGMTDKAMETYEMLKASGCCPDKLTFTILIRNLENAGREDLAAVLKKDCTEYLEYPERFLEQVQQKHVRNPIFCVLSYILLYRYASYIFPLKVMSPCLRNFPTVASLIQHCKTLVF